MTLRTADDGTEVRVSAVAPEDMRSAIHEVQRSLEDLRCTVPVDEDVDLLDRLEVAGEELRVLEAEIDAQLAELTAALRENADHRRLSQQVLAALPVPLLTTDVHGALLDLNPAAADLLGVAARHLHRKPVLAFLSDEDRRRVRTLLRAVVTDAASRDTDVAVRTRRGHQVSCRLSLVASGHTGQPPTRVNWALQPTGPDVHESPTAPVGTPVLLELLRIGVTDGDARDPLRRVVELAAGAVPAVDAASLSLGPVTEPELTVSSATPAQVGDGMQQFAMAGPSLEAQLGGEAVVTADLAADSRWPELAHHPVPDDGPRACVALPLRLGDEIVGVLTLYSAEASVLGDGTVAAAVPYVAVAEALVRDRRSFEEVVRSRDQLREALTSRATIDQAKGMIMMAERCTPDEAFALLVRMSNKTNRKLRDVAAAIVRQYAAEPATAPEVNGRVRDS
jgi:PAS domain S-box-containing protein